MKRIVLSIVLLTILTGCGSNETTTSEVASEVTTTSNTYEENVTGGTEVASIATNDMMLTDTDGDNILNPNKDDAVDNLDNSGFDYTVKVFDTDGDGIVSDEGDSNEQYTTVINLKNTSGRDIEVSDFKIYLQSADDGEPIEITYMDTGAIDSSKLGLGEADGVYANSIQYIDKETYDQFTFPKDNEITIVLTSTVSVAVDDIEPAELSFVALDQDGVSYYVESTTQFAAA